MHGFSGDKNSLKIFKNAFLNFKQIYFSLHSLEDECDEPLNIESYAKKVIETLNFLNIEKADFICHSFGGRVVFKIHQINPYVINKIVLMDVAGLKPKLTVKKCFNKICFKLLKKLKVKNLNKFFSKDYLSMKSNHKITFKNIVNEHFDNYICNIKNQTLIIWGKKDKDTPLYMARRINKKLENSSLKVIEDGDHFCYLKNNRVVLLAQFFLN